MEPRDMTTATETLREIGQGIDPCARLFDHQGRILRAIKPEHAGWFSDVLQKRSVQDLIGEGLIIGTKKSDVAVEGYPLVLEHSRLPYVNYPFEWTPSMFKAAAIAMLRVNLRLLEDGCMVHDPYAWNVMFDCTKPRFIDFTSIVPVSKAGECPGMIWFERYFLDTLRLMAAGFPTAARAMVHENLCYPDSDLARAIIVDDRRHCRRPFVRREIGRLIDAIRQCLAVAIRHVRHRLAGDRSLTTMAGMRHGLEEIEALDVRPPKANWSEYYGGRNELPVYDGSSGSLDAVRASTPKHQFVDRLLATLRPRTVLDIGCNNGLYSQMAASHGACVAGLDTDEYAIDSMFTTAASTGASILPFFANAAAPNEAVGLALKPMPRFIERVRADFVLCLALAHHLVLGRTSLSFDHVAELLGTYARSELLVEFVPADDRYLPEVYPSPPEWYSLARFEEALRRYFPRIERHPSFPAPRVLLHCSKDSSYV
jgi:SAM-dependent methyltransferase